MFEASNDVLWRFDQYIMRWKHHSCIPLPFSLTNERGRITFVMTSLPTRSSREVLSVCNKSSVRFEHGIIGCCCSYCFSHLRLPVLWHKSALCKDFLVIALVQWQRLCEACLAIVGECNVLRDASEGNDIGSMLSCYAQLGTRTHRLLPVMISACWAELRPDMMRTELVV